MRTSIKKHRVIIQQQKRRLLITCFVITMIVVACQQQEKKSDRPASTASTTNTVSEPVKPQEQKAFDRSILIGDWIRTDAEYRITISELPDDGTLKAGYFNPNPINVGKAGWSFSEGMMKLYIELRDENYPGSNYNLVYYPEKDLLAGKYFQAVEGVTYDVGFFRKK